MKTNLKWIFSVLVFVVVLPLVCAVCNLNVSLTENAYAAQQPTAISRAELAKYEIEDVDDAYEMLEDLRGAFGYGSARSVLQFDEVSDGATGPIYRFTQIYNGTRVYGTHLDISVGSNSKVLSVTGKYSFNLDVDPTINYAPDEATAEIYRVWQDAEVSFVEKLVYLGERENYFVYVYNVNAGNGCYEVYISARTGVIVNKDILANGFRDTLPSQLLYTVSQVAYTKITHAGEDIDIFIDKYTPRAGGQPIYVLGNAQKKIYVVDGMNLEADSSGESDYRYYDSTNGTFSDSVAIKAFEYLNICYDYYLNSENFGQSVVGMKNKNGRTITLIGIVHYGIHYQNAAFLIPSSSSDVGYFWFGDGGGLYGTNNFVEALDVVGHEYQHSLTNSKTNLHSLNADGAINEAISDMFGAAIEGNDISSDNFWRMGENVYEATDYLRDMANPSSRGCVASYSELKPFCQDPYCDHEDCDYGNVHYNCTLLTYAAYLMHTMMPSFFTTQNMMKLWYNTLCLLKENESFTTFANYMYQSAQNLGWNSSAVQTVYNAFAYVGIPGYDGIEIWGGNHLSTFEGAGTSSSPYLIKSERDLASLAYYINEGEDLSYLMATYSLESDIKLPATIAWQPIGLESRPFNGVFLGGGHKISGINLDNGQALYNGLFGYIGANGYVQSLVLQGQTQSSATWTGALVGKLEGQISSIGSNVDISGKNVGGLVGQIENYYGGRVITSSYVKANLTGDKVGGLASEISSVFNDETSLYLPAYISSSYADGTFTGKTVGGLVGSANSAIFVNDIVVATLKASEDGGVFGGIVGELCFINLQDNGKSPLDKVTNYIISCRSTANFETQAAARVGTILGANSGKSSDGVLYIENVIVKQREGVDFSFSALDQTNIKCVDIKTSTDEIFEGDFDFDFSSFYDDSNFTPFVGNDGFDLTIDFFTSSNSMPLFKNMTSWLSTAKGLFAGGKGTADEPYQISKAQELATLSALLLEDKYYSKLSTAYYVLTKDIDLDGMVWAGIGYTVTYVENGEEESALCPFMGSFDGQGHTISNLSSVGLYLTMYPSQDGLSYTRYDFSAGLFGILACNPSTNVAPTIKNLKLENVNVSGYRAGAVASVAYGAVNLSNISVTGVVNSSFTAGGLISTMYGLTNSGNAKSVIENCEVNASISGQVAGGAVGYATNPGHLEGQIDVINFLSRGKMRVFGLNLDSTNLSSGWTYYKGIGGGVFGMALTSQINIINTIILQDIIAYSKGSYIGGFIGAIGARENFCHGTIQINITGGKVCNNSYYIFDRTDESSGAILGGTHIEVMTNVSLNVDSTTVVNSNNVDVQTNELGGGLTQNCNPTKSTDALGEGAFDIYNDDYYTNAAYFDQDYAWGQELTDRMYYVVTLLNDDGTLIKQFTLKMGERINLDEVETPHKDSTPAFDFAFIGWSQNLSTIHSSGKVYARYESLLRSYEIEFWANGKLIDKRLVNYGSDIPQDIEAPEKKGNFMFKYTFTRWGEKGQRVEGAMRVEAVYKRQLNVGAYVLIAIVLVATISVCGYFFLRRR